GGFIFRGVLRVALCVVLWLGVPGVANAAAPAELANRPRLALAARDGVAYAVVESGDPAKPFALVSEGSRPEPVGGPGAKSPEIAVGPEGTRVAWARQISAGLELLETPANDVTIGKRVAT